MFWRNGNALAKSRDEDWPGLGTWFPSSEACPECQPHLVDQLRTIADAKARAENPEPQEKPDPPGLGEWFATSEDCPECQPYLEEQAAVLKTAHQRPQAPQRAIRKARERSAAMVPLLDEPIPDIGRFEWDLPEDHEMSIGGKIFWNVAIYGAIAAVPLTLLILSPFTPQDTARHYAAMAGCEWAQMLSLTPARDGEPGYHSHLDTDGDGIACEAEASRRLTNGNSPFIRAPGN